MLATSRASLIALTFVLLVTSVDGAEELRDIYSFDTCGPESVSYSEISDPFDKAAWAGSSTGARGNSNTAGLDLAFCSKWNPDFRYNGHHCCAKVILRRRRRRGRCAPERRTGSYCRERTDGQKDYIAKLESGAIPDALGYLTEVLGRTGTQSYCSVNNGFLYEGKPIVPSAKNRIVLRNPERCAEYASDGMAAMLEWLGREVGKKYAAPDYKGVHLLLSDIAAPRGGCIGHASHRTGLDADVGFLVAKEGKKSPINLHRQFDVAQNWWLIKQIFQNPYACVRVVFLDRKIIGKLAREIGRGKLGGPEEMQLWEKFRRFVRHMPRHKDHLHVRVGEFPGQPGCFPDAKPESEEEEELIDGSEDEGAPEADTVETPASAEP